jgi:hypothetical protein
MGIKTFIIWTLAIFESVDKARICTGLARQGGQQAMIKKIMLS